jgi:hypothetical protein
LQKICWSRSLNEEQKAFKLREYFKEHNNDLKSSVINLKDGPLTLPQELALLTSLERIEIYFPAERCHQLSNIEILSMTP